MNAKKLIMKMAAAFVAAAVFSSTAVAVSANAENSVYYWGTYKDEKKVSLQVDETYQLDLGDDPDNVKIINNDDAIASVSSTGLVTARKPGTCRVRLSHDSEMMWYEIKVATYKYKIEDGKAIILKYCGSSKTVTVPTKIGGKFVTEIGSKAFYKNTSVQTIKLPEYVLTLGKNVFSGCKNLKKVTYRGKTYSKKQLTSLSKAVAAEARLTASEIPADELECYIDNGSMCIYKYNGNAENIVIPRKYDGHEIIVLNDDAFAGHTEIKSVSMPDSVYWISNGVFSGCTSLTDISITDTVYSIGCRTFENCESLEKIELPSKVDRIYDKTFKGCVSLKTVILPDGLEEIYSEAFADCFSLKDLYLPDSIDKIESDAFKGCKNLKLHYKGKVFNISNKKDIDSLRYDYYIMSWV